MFELKHDTPAARAHSARVGLASALVALVLQAATLLFGQRHADMHDVALSAVVVMMASDAASRLWAENRLLAAGVRMLSIIATFVGVLALIIG